jgi:hypothetical protein
LTLNTWECLNDRIRPTHPTQSSDTIASIRSYLIRGVAVGITVAEFGPAVWLVSENITVMAGVENGCGGPTEVAGDGHVMKQPSKSKSKTEFIDYRYRWST